MSGLEGVNSFGVDDAIRTYDVVKRGLDLSRQFEIRGKTSQVYLSCSVYFKKYYKMDEAQTEVQKAFETWKADNYGTSEYEYENHKFTLISDFEYLEPEYDPENLGIFEEYDPEEVQVPYVTGCSCFLKPVSGMSVEGAIRNGYWFLRSALNNLSESEIELKSNNIFVTIQIENKTGTQLLESLQKEIQKKKIPYPPISPSKINFESIQIKIPITDYSVADILISNLKPKLFGKFG